MTNLNWVDRIVEEWLLLETLSQKSMNGALLGWHIGSIEVGVSSQPDINLIQNLQARQFILSQKVKDRLCGNLKMSLIDGVQNKEGIEGITKRINEVFIEMKRYELERIVRTEVITSANQARQEAWKSNPSIKYKMWLSKFPYDKRVADDSKRLVGQVQSVDKPFVDWKTGQEVMQPPLHPNDRCTSIPLTNLPKDIVEWKELQYSNRYLDRGAI